LVFHNATPELFRGHLREAVSRVKDRPADQRIVFLKAWNEWAEGNHVEPDLKWGRAWLEVIRDEVGKYLVMTHLRQPRSEGRMSRRSGFGGRSSAAAKGFEELSVSRSDCSGALPVPDCICRQPLLAHLAGTAGPMFCCMSGTGDLSQYDFEKETSCSASRAR